MPDFWINSITIDQDQWDSILKKWSLNFDIREWLDFWTLLSACWYNKNIRVTVLVWENGSWKTSICNLLTNKKELEWIDVSSLGDYNIVKKNILSLSKYAWYWSERHYNIFHKAALLNYKHSKWFRFLSEYIQSNFSKKINLNKLYLKWSLNLKFNFWNDDVTRSWFINTLFQRKFHFLKILIDKDRPNLYDFVIYNKDFLPAILDIDKIREILESNYDYMSKVIQSLSLFSIKLLSNITKKNKEKVSLEEDVLSIWVNELNKLKLFFDSKSNQQYEFKSSIEWSSFTSTKAGRRIRKEAPHLFSIKWYIWDISINKISSWENILINDFLQLLNWIEDSDSSDFIIIIDEAALHLHIKRQKKYIKSIVDFISEDYFSWKTFHIILTTHSPYIVTDIPINIVVRIIYITIKW